MKVAVTGISGYLGGVLVRLLQADPAVESILGLDIVEPSSLPAKAVFTKADVRDAPFASLLTGMDALYHLAFIVEPPRRMPMTEIDRINVEGSRRVFEGALAAGVPKIIYASSVSAYGAHSDNPVPLVEDDLLRPNQDWYYSRTKGAVEEILDVLQQRRPAAVIIRFRPSIFLGPSIRNTIGKAIAGRVLFCLTPDPKIDLAWDEDIAEAFRLALHYDRSDIFNLAGDGPLTTREMGRLLHRRVIVVPAWWLMPVCRLAARLGLLSPGMLEWLRVPSNHSILVNAEKAKARLGWRPRHTAAQALIRYVNNLPAAPAEATIIGLVG